MAIELKKAKVPKGERVYAIGDIHGCLKQLKKLLRLIDLDLEASPVKKHHFVFLGDYVDRGPDSKGVIDRLIKLRKNRKSVFFLKGNHEAKLMDFLGATDNLTRIASGFFAFGGLEACQSYGVETGTIDDAIGNAKKLRRKLVKNIPYSHLDFLNNLKTSATIGDYFFCHAGIRPDVKLKKQSDHDLIWIRQEFLVSKKLYKKIVVHGHTPSARPEVMDNRINVDTKCYDSGVLTCLVLQGRKQRFIQSGK